MRKAAVTVRGPWVSKAPFNSTCALAQVGVVNRGAKGSRIPTIAVGSGGKGGHVWCFSRLQTIPPASRCRQLYVDLTLPHRPLDQTMHGVFPQTKNGQSRVDIRGIVTEVRQNLACTLLGISFFFQFFIVNANRKYPTLC